MTQTANTGPAGEIAQLLDQANRQRLSDQFDAARLSCHDVFARDPANAAAMCLLGVCDLETGEVEAGRAWLDKAEAANPALPQLHLYRSIQWEVLGEERLALAAAQRASELGPDRFDVWGRLGDLAGRAGDYAAAAQALEKALVTGPGHAARPQIGLRLAGARAELGDLPAARAALDIAEQGGLRGHPEVLRLRAVMARQAGDWTAMEVIAQAWVVAAPDDHEALSARAQALGQLGYYARAARIYRPVAEAAPEQADNWAALGRLVLGARDIAGAQSLFEQALALDADNAEACFGLARVNTFLGQFEQAESMCRRTLAIEPGHLEAYGQLCEVASGRLSDAELAGLREAVEQPGLAADRLAIGLFALGDALHHRKLPREAFQAWSRANATKKVQHGHAVTGGYDRAAQEARTANLMEIFPHRETAELAKLPAIDIARPIFIVGMPRSGTTLIEAAIAAHEDVVAGGELSALPFIFEDFLAWVRRTGWTGGEIPALQRMAWRKKYFAQHAEFGLDQAQWVTDKQPSNFLAVGLIRQLFPEAPVIQIRRRPVETAFSIFRRNFSRQWPFAHDLEDIAHYYAQQARLCAHWEGGRRFTPLQYEELIADFEPKLRYVIARTGLGWSRQCLDFHTQERSVMTFSSVQVRQPASSKHLNTSDAYGEELAGFDALIAGLGVDPQTGAWLGVEGAQPAPDDAARGAGAKRGLGSIMSGLFGGRGRGE